MILVYENECDDLNINLHNIQIFVIIQLKVWIKTSWAKYFSNNNLKTMTEQKFDQNFYQLFIKECPDWLPRTFNEFQKKLQKKLPQTRITEIQKQSLWQSGCSFRLACELIELNYTNPI